MTIRMEAHANVIPTPNSKDNEMNSPSTPYIIEDTGVRLLLIVEITPESLPRFSGTTPKIKTEFKIAFAMLFPIIPKHMSRQLKAKL